MGGEAKTELSVRAVCVRVRVCFICGCVRVLSDVILVFFLVPTLLIQVNKMQMPYEASASQGAALYPHLPAALRCGVSTRAIKGLTTRPGTV